MTIIQTAQDRLEFIQSWAASLGLVTDREAGITWVSTGVGQPATCGIRVDGTTGQTVADSIDGGELVRGPLVAVLAELAALLGLLEAHRSMVNRMVASELSRQASNGCC